MQLANALSLPAKSLQFERPPIRLPPPLDNKMGKFLLSMLGFYSHKSQLLHGTCGVGYAGCGWCVWHVCVAAAGRGRGGDGCCERANGKGG